MKITNQQIRRWLRKYVEHYNGNDSRYIIDLFHMKLSCSKQRVSGNISWAIVGQKQLRVKTNIAGMQSDLLKV